MTILALPTVRPTSVPAPIRPTSASPPDPPLHRELLAALGLGWVSTAAWLAALCANSFAASGTRASGECALDIATLFVLSPPESAAAAITYVDVTGRHHGLAMTRDAAHDAAVAVMSGLSSAVPHRPHPRGTESTASLFLKGH